MRFKLFIGLLIFSRRMVQTVQTYNMQQTAIRQNSRLACVCISSSASITLFMTITCVRTQPQWQNDTGYHMSAPLVLARDILTHRPNDLSAVYS